MKIVQYRVLSQSQFNPGRLGVIHPKYPHQVVDVNFVWQRYYQKKGVFNPLHRSLSKAPCKLSSLLNACDEPISLLQETLDYFFQLEQLGDHQDIAAECFKLMCPVDIIPTYRDFFTHEKHVATGFKKRGEKIPEAWYQLPVFYKGSPHQFLGDQDIVTWPYYTKELDYELELAAVVGKDTRNMQPDHYREALLGFTILNDISARDIQRLEMQVRLGPSKAKDFCSVLGPCIVTLDEFKDQFALPRPPLRMTATINGEVWSEGFAHESHYDISELLSFASMEEWLLPGDVLGFGTVGTGCGLEINKWLQPGDTIKLEVDLIGSLTNTIANPNERPPYARF